MNTLRSRLLSTLILAFALTGQAIQVRVRDLAFVYHAQDNQLIGYGLVTGLNNDGDKNLAFTLQSIANFLQKFGLTLPATALSSKNAAAVMVTADIPPFAKTGSRIDVTVSALGDAKSLQGGVLLITPLAGVDGKMYATAQGPLALGGFSLGAGGAGGATVQKNHPTTAQIINGALVVEEIAVNMVHNDSIDLVLKDPDFTTSARLAEAINAKYPSSSHAIDGAKISVKIPDTYRTAPVDFIGQLWAIDVTPDTPARIILNEKTGTIVATSRIKIAACAVTHANIIVKTSETLDVSQPSPFAQTGQTVTTPRTDVQVTEERGKLKALPDLPTVERVAAALNEMGVTSRDIMSIFETMKQAGALQAELIIR